MRGLWVRALNEGDYSLFRAPEQSPSMPNQRPALGKAHYTLKLKTNKPLTFLHPLETHFKLNKIVKSSILKKKLSVRSYEDHYCDL